MVNVKAEMRGNKLVVTIDLRELKEQVELGVLAKLTQVGVLPLRKKEVAGEQVQQGE